MKCCPKCLRPVQPGKWICGCGHELAGDEIDVLTTEAEQHAQQQRRSLPLIFREAQSFLAAGFFVAGIAFLADSDGGTRVKEMMLCGSFLFFGCFFLSWRLIRTRNAGATAIAVFIALAGLACLGLAVIAGFRHLRHF